MRKSRNEKKYVIIYFADSRLQILTILIKQNVQAIDSNVNFTLLEVFFRVLCTRIPHQ